MSLRGALGDPSKHFDDFLNTSLSILVEKERAARVHNALERHADAVFSDMMLGRDMFEPEPVSPRNPPCGKDSGPTLVIHHDSKPIHIQSAEVIVTKADDDAGPKFVSIDAISSTPAPAPTPVTIEPPQIDEEEEEEDEEDEGEVVEDVDEEDDQDDDEGEVVEEVEEEAEQHDDEGEVVEEVEEEVEQDDDEGEVVEEVEDEVNNEEDEGEVVEEVEDADNEEEEVVEEVEEEADETEVEVEEEEGVELMKIGRKNYFVGENSKLVYEAIDEDTPGDTPLGRYENGKITKL
jgi:hypothetical protein